MLLGKYNWKISERNTNKFWLLYYMNTSDASSWSEKEVNGVSPKIPQNSVFYNRKKKTIIYFKILHILFVNILGR